MFKRDIIIISLIVMLFTVSSVCAADSEYIGAHNSTDIMAAVNDNDLMANDANEILAETDDSAALDEAINGVSDTYIELNKSYHGSFNGGNGIKINRANIVIDGKGYTIDCTGENSRMLDIDKEGITLKNIKFTGGYSDCGGAIYTNKDLTIINCTFISNQATGGATEQGGGAIFGYNVKMSIYDCTFIGNHANSMGGAIAAMDQTSSDDWEIFNCTFIDNSATVNGGAFYTLAYNRMGNIINSTFINNRAANGDVIYMFYADDATIDRCIFVNNTANSMIYAYHAVRMIVNNSIIVNNYGDVLLNDQYEPIYGNNWWGTTADKPEAPVVAGSTISNYYVLNMTADDDSADITLNNLYENDAITHHYANYALPSINFTVKAKNVEVLGTVALGSNGMTTIEHAPAAVYEITIKYNGVELTRDVKPTFKWLNDKISEGSEVSLEQDCIYDSAKDSILTNGIEFSKDMTIDGQGYVIDARGSGRIFYFDDDTNSYSLTLKNIIFANATGANGAAVYFKGNKLEIINCTFINNNADYEGDAVYVANAVSNANRITESVFIENTGNNSAVYLNLDSNANLKLDNSIFMSNNAAKDIKGTGNVIAEYNWWGNTFENKANISKTEGVNVTNWLFLKIDAVPAMTGTATISLNNVYDGSEESTYTEYALQSITFGLGGLNATTSVPTITLGDNGQANYQFRMDRATATLTASYDNVTTSDELKYSVVDDGSFRALNEIIFFSDDGSVIELTHDYVYFDTDTITEGIVIPRKITINGNGHTIDAKGKTRIFTVPEGVPHVTINNICFINAKIDHGSVIIINKGSNYFNFSNCNFTNNSATSYGGVIDCVGDFCTIDNCNFINNSAVDKAGVIRYYHDIRADIKNSNFINNRVADGSDGGGVIYVDEGALNIDKSTFINNVANDKPGSVLYTTKPATITNSIFLNNPGFNVIHGGSGVKLANNWFGNTSGDYNSFADGNKTLSAVYSKTTLINWLYLDIIFFDDYAIISLDNAYYKSSNSTDVISNYNLPEITLDVDSQSLGLNTKITLDGKGQARVDYDRIPDDAKLTVSNEYVSLTEDAIVDDFYNLQWLISENDEIELDHDFVCNNGSCITEGIAIKRNAIIDGRGHTIDAAEMTGIFNVPVSNVTFKNIIFANGKSDLDHGGAICIKSNGGSYSIENCTFINNTAKDKGGAIYINARNAEFNIYDSRFMANTGEHDGALYIETNNSKITVDKCLFRENKAVNDSYENNGNAIVWNTANDNGNNTVKNSVFLDNGYQCNGMHTFMLLSGNVTIDDNWWGTTSKNPQAFNSSFVGGITPSTWLFINSSLSSNRILLNEIAKIKYHLQAHDGTNVTDFDNSKLPYVDFDVGCNMGELDKDNVSLNEEFTFRTTDIGNALVDICCNGIAYETCIYGPYMIARSDVPFLIYVNQSLGKDEFIKTANGYYSNVTVTFNDSSLFGLDGNNVCAKVAEGTVKLTFSYGGSYQEYPYAEDLDIIVKVVKVPLNITVLNLESREITLTVTDTFNLDIAFVIDEMHKEYAPATGALGAKFNSTVILFSSDDGTTVNGSYYTTGHITAKAGGTTDLTFYSASDKFTCENYTIKITVNKIHTAIRVDGNDSFKVDDTNKLNASFLINGSQSTAALTYESSDVNVVNFTSNAGDFRAVGSGDAVLTVKFAGNSTHESSQAALPVTVTKYVTVTTVTSDKSLSLKIDEKSQIKATLDPDVGTLEYVSSNESVATVSSTGLINAHKKGTATITVRYADDGRKYESSQDTISITVSKNATAITAEDMALNSTDENIDIGAFVNVTGDYTLNYSSDNENVVTVSADGRLTAVSGGQAQVTITYAESEKYLSSTKTIKVTVNKLETKILVETPISTRYNETITINQTVVNANGTKIDVGTISYFIGGEQISNPFTVDRVGKFNITVKYAENAKYKESELNVTVNSDKAENIISVSVDDGVYRSNITVKVTAGQDGNYTVDINGTLVNVEVVNGKGQNTIPLDAGSYYANVTGYESPLFYGVTSNDTFTVAKADSCVDIDVLNEVIHVMEAINVRAVVPAGATGNVTFRLGDDKTVDVGEIATFDGLSAGTYTIYAIYNGDNNYKASREANITINVVKYNLNLGVGADDITYGGDAVVKVTANANFTGDVLVKVGQLNQTVHVAKGEGKTTFDNLAAGKYVITANFTGDGTFYGVAANGTFTVAKADSFVEIDVLNDVIHVGEAINVKAVVPAGATGNVTFRLTGDMTVNVGEVATFDGLAYGTYVIYAIYNGDSNYNASRQANATISVVKYESKIIAENPVITKYLETITLDPTVVNANGTKIGGGNISYFIDDKSIANPFTVGRVGEFNITVKYSGDSRYLPSELNVTVISDKAKNNIVVSVDDTVYPNEAIIKVTAAENGNYSVDINGTLVKVEVVNGEGQNAVVLDAGSYYANVTGYESPLFYGVTSNDTFAVSKGDSDVRIVVLNYAILAGDAINVKAVVPAGATGNVTFRLGEDKTVGVGEVATFDGLDIGTYIIYAVYNGDGNYKASKEANATINVVKYAINLNVAADNVTYGEPLVVKVTANENFTGDLTVHAGDNSEIAHITKGEGNVTFANLAKGEYFISVNFTYDGTFNSDSKNTTATVKGFETPLIIDYSTPVINENVTISVAMDEDITGNVTVTIDNNTFTKKVVAGKLEFNIAATYGVHNIAVAFNGNDKYYPALNSTSFAVDKLNIDLGIISESVDYGVDLVVKVNTNAKFTGDVLVKVAEFNQTAHIVDGRGNVTFTNLAAGEYLITVDFTGDDTFNADSKNATVVVNRVKTSLVITHSDAVIHNNVTVTVIMDGDLNDNVTVNVNGVSTINAVVNGSLVFDIANVSYGPQNIAVSFSGNEIYGPMENSTQFFVNYLDSNLAISAETVNYGEPLVVVVNANDGLTCDVMVVIGSLTQSVHVADGLGNATFDALAAGEHFITAAFVGDGTFASASASTTGVVKGVEVPANQTIDVNVPTSTGTSTFSFNLTNATGNFTVVVDGKEVATKELVNGSASVTVDDLPAGEHNITLIYSGDGKYAPIVENTTSTISKMPTAISASAVSTVYGVSKKLTLTLKDANNVALSNKTVKIVLNGVTYSGATNANGQFSMVVSSNLAAKTYTAKITFDGDGSYLKSSKDVKVVVNKVKSVITAKKKTFKKSVKTKKYAITLKANSKPIKKVKVTLKVKGKTYRATTNNNGKATFKIKILTKKGKYTAAIKFAGNKNYKSTSKKVKITVK